MSPVQRHDPNLRNLDLGSVPGGRPPVEDDEVLGVDDIDDELVDEDDEADADHVEVDDIDDQEPEPDDGPRLITAGAARRARARREAAERAEADEDEAEHSAVDEEIDEVDEVEQGEGFDVDEPEVEEAERLEVAATPATRKPKEARPSRRSRQRAGTERTRAVAAVAAAPTPAAQGVSSSLRTDGGNRSHDRAFKRLYRGETRFDFVGRRRWWFALSLIIIVAGMASLGVRGLNLGINFKGGTAWQVSAPAGVTQNQVVNTVQGAGLNQPTVEILGSGNTRTIEVQADLNGEPKSQQQDTSHAVTTALAKLTHTNDNGISVSNVGPTWGGQVTQRALTALIIFFVVVVIYISFRFEPKMALAAFIAMVHDLLVTIGVYSLSGLQVSPDTVVAILTILGYSLYDTVVVFDRVRDNARGVGASGRMTYSDMVNLSMNQTLARSINTSLVAILPVFAVLVVGAEILGATTLQDFGLALLVGLLSGAYSSIFIASPLLAMMKEREHRYQNIRQRLETRGDRIGVLTPTAAAALSLGGGAGVSLGRSGGSGAPTATGRRPPRPSQARKNAPLRPGAGAAAQAARTAPSAGRAGAGRAGAGQTATLVAEGERDDQAETAGMAGDHDSDHDQVKTAPVTAQRRPAVTPRPRKKTSKNRKRR